MCGRILSKAIIYRPKKESLDVFGQAQSALLQNKW